MTSENIPPTGVPSRKLAATSWLWPTTLADNLSRIGAWNLPVRQAALLFYQSALSLAYTQDDIPPVPGLESHVHLPVDLPWKRGAAAVYAVISRLMELAGNLSPWGGVLHPPEAPGLLESVAALWREAAPGWRLLVENVPGQGLRRHWPVIQSLELPVCLDVGHMMAFGQTWLPGLPGLWERVELLHCYAPGTETGKHSHLALDRLTPGQEDELRAVFEALPAKTPVLFEVFSEEDLRASLEKFYGLHHEWGTAP
ncbi:cobamide remodeling phosphodiesterase CbiR [Fundidesulfovibrio soli]|uniref:cobamide remodeling phosphodiesterase CbiR n=1 Tax=Fundidesulfovibrio soli TaxID=2922716 RepID=UPI001FAE7BB4|nr:cobamide remodeling phosphodiesterase CbiR [Fundidesulfovibrio soli]